MKRLTAAALLTLALVACDRDRAREGPLIGGDKHPASEPPTAAGESGRSIFREDIVQPEPIEAALEPLEATIGFAEGGSELSEDARDELAAVLESPQLEAGWPIVLRGHSDAGGAGDVNLRVSRQRAQAVRDWLIENGIEEERITVIAFGEQNPAEPNALPDGTPDEKGRAANRRVEISIANPSPPAEEEREPTIVEQLAQEAEADSER